MNRRRYTSPELELSHRVLLIVILLWLYLLTYNLLLS